MVDESTTVLDRKHVNRMLVHILRTGEVGSMDFTWMTTNWRIVDDNLRAMVDAGLLEIHIPPKGRKTIRYSMTDMGRMVAIAELIQQESVLGRFDITNDIIGSDLMKLWNGCRILRGQQEDGPRYCSCRQKDFEPTSRTLPPPLTGAGARAVTTA